jgi:hypothetical protein
MERLNFNATFGARGAASGGQSSDSATRMHGGQLVERELDPPEVRPSVNYAISDARRFVGKAEF